MKNVNELSVHRIKGMPEATRQEFFTEAAKEMIGAALVIMLMKEIVGRLLRVAEKESV
jgi:uncharacterized ion transporter superfamily protein YfcC